MKRSHYERARHYRGRTDDPHEAKSLENGCKNKLGFPSKRKARARAAMITERTEVTFSAYRCLHCKRWHLTSKPQ